MRARKLLFCAMGVLVFGSGPPARPADDMDDKIARIEKQLEDLQKQLAELRESQAEQHSDTQMLKEAVAEPEGPVQAAIADVSKLKRIKVSGYLQARYESYDRPGGSPDKADNKSVDNRFYARRGRFKITGQPTDHVVGVAQLDIANYDRSKTESKDLYLEYHPWGIGTPAPFFVRFGQQNWPFGSVIERSSSAREVPERPKVFAGTTVNLTGGPTFNGLFPGERDKGIALFSTETSKLDWALGLFNGAGTKAGDAGSSFLENGGRFEDNNSGKAIVGRVRYPLNDILQVGASLFSGSQAVRPISGAEAISVSQSRWGLDFQCYLQGASLRGEYVRGKEPYYSNTGSTPNGTSGTNRSVSGWYLTGVKNLGDKYQAVVQYDSLNDRAMSGTFGELTTWNLGIIRFLDESTKIKLFYEINEEEKKPVGNNGLRLEMLTAF